MSKSRTGNTPVPVVNTTTLITKLITNIGNLVWAEQGISDVIVQNALSSASVDDMANGLPPHRMLSALINTISDPYQTDGSFPTIGKMWNPLTALFANTLEKILLSPIPRVAAKAKLQSTRKIAKSSPVKGTEEAASKVNAKTKKERKSLDSNIPEHIAQIVRPNHDKVFSNLKHVRCKTPSCTFCKQLWYALPYSKCSEIACHAKNTNCHESGWYKHVLPIAWSKLRKSHESGKLPKKYTTTYLLEELDNPLTDHMTSDSLSSASTITDNVSITSSTASRNKRLAHFEAEYRPSGSHASSIHSSDDSLVRKVRRIDLAVTATPINSKGKSKPKKQ